MAASYKKEMLIMVLRPTIFRVEANSFEDAKKTITNQLITSGQMKPNDPIEFREMIDYELKNQTTSNKTSFGDWSANEYIFNINDLVLHKKIKKGVKHHDR